MLTKNQIARRAFWELLSFEPHPKQLAVLDSPAPIKLFVAGTKAGKTYSGIYYLLERMLLTPGKLVKGAIIAPIKDQCRLSFDQVYLKLKELKQQIDPDHARSKGYFRTKNFHGGYSDLQIYSTDDPKTLFGAKWDFVLCDEGAQMLDNIWRDYIASNARDILIATTPEATGSWIEDIFNKGQIPDNKRYFSVNLDTFSNTKMSGYSADGNHTGDYLDLWLKAEEDKKYFPETYNRRYMGKFTISDRNYFRNIDPCIDDELKLKDPSNRNIFVIKEPIPGEFYSTGIDLARYRDKTVIQTFDVTRTLCYMEILENTEWDIQEQRIKWVAEKYPGVVQVDATGVGDRVAAILANHHGVAVDPIVFNRKGVTRSTMRDEILSELTMRMANTNLRFPRIPELLEALRTVRISQTSAGREVIGDGSGHLPDVVSAMALALWGLRDFPTNYEIKDRGEDFLPVHKPDEGYDEMSHVPIWSDKQLVDDYAR